MKKIIILSVISIIFAQTTFAQNQYSATIGKIENSLFGIEYSNQNIAKRLERIEENVYGKVGSGDISIRITKLSKDVAADGMGKEITPKEDTFADDEPTYRNESVPKADSSVNYPVINNLENIVFNKEFKEMELSQRIANLEKKAFNREYANDDFNSRVERLKEKFLPQKTDNFDTNLAQKEFDNFYSENFPSQNNYFKRHIKNPKSVFDFQDENASVGFDSSLAALEKSVLKKNYNNDMVENRLSRLEAKMFSTNFSEDDNATRIQRLASAHHANKSAKKYDSGKFQRHLSTAMQVGTILLMVLAMVL